MIQYRIIERPAFDIIGKKTWISGQDNGQFGRFWEQCREEGLFEIFGRVNGFQPGTQTNCSTLGVSRVENDPSNRDFYYMIAIEKPDSADISDLECYQVPASKWAVFECRGPVPSGIVASEIYAFTEWLPASDYVHAPAPEMEVYPVGGNPDDADYYCEFWLPIIEKS